MKTLVFRCALFAAFSVAALAAPVVLTFEGLRDQEAVNGFYNGGTGGAGSTGTNYGIEFVSGSLAIIDSDAGGTGNFGGEPSPSTILFFLSGTAVMNYAAGFDTGFSFFYSAINNPAVVNVYSGLNLTGSLLATINLPITASDGGDPTGSFSPFVPIGVAFAGTAMSVDFGGTANQVGFDNVTFGSATAGGDVPEPATMLLLTGGLGAISALRRRSA